MRINDISEEKARLRKRYIKIRASLTAREKSLSDGLILRRLVSSDVYKNAAAVFTYVSKGGETDTRLFIKQALRDNKTVAVPKCRDGCRMDFYYIRSESDLETGAFGILEPKKGLVRAERPCGLCVVPGLCFDKEGFRLGYGKGYYDRFLADFNGTSVGICGGGFLADRLPRYSTDRRVDMIITDKDIYITD